MFRAEEGIVIETPPVRRRLLGAALRRYRESLGYRLDDSARILECDRSKISRIESGQRGIRARDLRDLLTEYGVGEQEQRTLAAIAHPDRARGWWQPYADVLPGAWLDYLITETAASQIQAYQPQLVPDLLQTQEYARAVVAADPALPTGTQDLVIKAMLTRQQVILWERRPELAVVIGEGALHQVVGGSQVMRAQLARLAEMSGTCPQITIQVLPFAYGAHPAGGSGTAIDPAVLRDTEPRRGPPARPLQRDLPGQPAGRCQPCQGLRPAEGLRAHPGRGRATAPGHSRTLTGARLGTPLLAHTTNTGAITYMPLQDAARLQAQRGAPLPVITDRRQSLP